MIRPTVVYEPFDGKVEVRIYGKSPCELEWPHVVHIARVLGLKHLYRPQTNTFNAQVCRRVEFGEELETSGVKIYTGAMADGVVISGREQAVWLQTADCPTIIAYHRRSDEIVVAHAGRASLIDEGYLRNGKTKRQPESVAQTIYRSLIDFGRRTSVDIEVFSCGGVGPINFRHPTDHPQHGPFNQKMNCHIALNYGIDCFLSGKTAYGALDLHRLIRNQFALCGVPIDNIRNDSIDIARLQKLFFSRRGGDRIGHNTILVTRRA